MANTAKKTPAKRKPAQRPEELRVEPGVIEMESVPADTKFEKVPVFSIDGETYFIDDKPRANLAVKFMWRMKTVGEEEASLELLPEVLGEDLMMVLMSYEGLTGKHLEAITEKVMTMVFGGDEVDSQGN